MALIEEWQQTTGKTFSVCGEAFDEFVKKRYHEYTADKENEKMQRVSIAEIVMCMSIAVTVLCAFALFLNWDHFLLLSGCCLVIRTSAINCLESLVSKITCDIMLLNSTHSPSHLCRMCILTIIVLE